MQNGGVGREKCLVGSDKKAETDSLWLIAI